MDDEKAPDPSPLKKTTYKYSDGSEETVYVNDRGQIVQSVPIGFWFELSHHRYDTSAAQSPPPAEDTP